ncbi:hypothetical protein JNUCC1_03071 [Lentibacillus sp. JNUCC-1]|nr:hypothetical protein [Lentibacillus sp. JNUCC-1]
MAIKSCIKGFLVSLAVLFIVFQPVMVPVSHAVESWTGDPWKGDSWEGDSWDGSNFKWEGDSWSEDGWTGDATEGTEAANGEGWNGQKWESQPWYMRGWNGGNGFTGDSWQENGWNSDGSHTGDNWSYPGWAGAASKGDGWNESGFQGSNPWNQNGYQGGDPWSEGGYAGDPFSNQGFAGAGYSGGAWQEAGSSGAGAFSGPDGYTPPERFYDSNEFKETKFVTDKLITGTANFVHEGLNDGFSSEKTGLHLTDLFVSGAKLQTGDHWAYDMYDMTSTAKDGYDKVSKLESLRKAEVVREITTRSAFRANQISNTSKVQQYASIIKDSAGQVSRNMDISNVSGTWSKMGALSKFNFVTSGVNAGISAYKTGASFSDAVNTFNSDATGTEKTVAAAKVGTNFGETLMSAGGVAAAVPGGQAVGAGLAAAGAGVFVVSKGVELVAKNKEKIAATAKKATDTVKKAASKGWKKVKGWFS